MNPYFLCKENFVKITNTENLYSEVGGYKFTHIFNARANHNAALQSISE